MTRIIISEKPSMGRAIAAALGIQGTGRNFIQGADVIVTGGTFSEIPKPCADRLMAMFPKDIVEASVAVREAWKVWTWPLVFL